MDTTQAIATLTILSQNLGAQIGLAAGQKEAVDIAIQQLQGTLTTQLTELETVKAQLDTATATIETLAPADATPVEITPLATPPQA